MIISDIKLSVLLLCSNVARNFVFVNSKFIQIISILVWHFGMSVELLIDWPAIVTNFA